MSGEINSKCLFYSIANNPLTNSSVPSTIGPQENKESGQVGSVTAHEEQSQQRASNHAPASQINTPSNAVIENLDSSNGGLVFYENAETLSQSRE